MAKLILFGLVALTPDPADVLYTCLYTIVTEFLLSVDGEPNTVLIKWD